jgi:hypothetical protein
MSPTAWPPRKQPLVPTEQEAGLALDPVWTIWKREYLFPLPEIEPQFFDHPARRLIIKIAEPLRLQVVMGKGNEKEKKRRVKRKNEAQNFNFFLLILYHTSCAT